MVVVRMGDRTPPTRLATPTKERSAGIVRSLHMADERLPDLVKKVLDEALSDGDVPLRERTGALRTIAEMAAVKARVMHSLGMGREGGGKGGTSIFVQGDLTVEALRAMSEQERETKMLQMVSGADDGEFVAVVERSYDD